MNKQRIPTFIVGALVGILIATIMFSFIVRSNNSIDESHTNQSNSNVTLVKQDRPQKARTLQLAHNLGQHDPVHIAMEKFAELVTKHSNGSLKVVIYPNATLGTQTQCLENLQQGQLAMTKSSAAPIENFIPEYAVFSLPYVFKNNEHYWQILNGPIGQELLTLGKNKGLIGICYYDAGARSFYTKTKPIMTPDDLDKVKIRVMKSSPTAVKLISTLGGSPTPMNFGDLYTGLQSNLVGGAENNLPSYLNSRHYEVTKYYSFNEHTRVPDMLLFSTEIWDTLNEQQQTWIKQAAQESSDFQRTLWEKASSEALEKIKAAGVEVSYPNPTPFRARVKPMHDQAMNTAAGPYLKRILETP
ncbi:2,3-diketo-L-gulonate-binding periplasmic protein YiaO precursor [Poriferisphaera corsica]|uniref:2,3-diketo-L-gulonate-binding periplasmic protein YiaO n=1 Tax=Poriferisphaera corsica TaxID=2528020 RepID=A0A517YW19_9BACT|nr:TRAP transporter substrate-binding protein [Poriferisphaera corsica]QDU34414.1 2,3-diketo-L-gulonate-binding periplasmic protein YiaO precursor [Poriferisphaera corsica]